MFTIFLLIIGVTTQEVPTPASLLGPRDFNYHPYEAQFLKETKVEPTKQGPVLFPNDAPPPPRRPLVVTSRPLIESIIKSDLNPNPPNNSIAEPSQINNIFKPYVNQNYGQDLFDKDLPDTYNNVEYQASSYPGVPYGNSFKNIRVNQGQGFNNNGYNDYEERTILPIYKALSDHAQKNVADLQKHKVYNKYQPKNVDYENHYENNDVSDENHNPEYDENQNYAFSYTVRDHKTGDDFSHSQQSSGSATNGEYRVRLPDGRTQIVSYTADENGYKANVRYDDEKPNSDYYNINNYNNNPVSHNTNNVNNVNNYNANPVNYNTHNANNINNYNANPVTHNINNVNRQEIPVKEEQYNTKDYYDYSAEYNNNYQPYRTKYNFNEVTTVAPVRPSYNDIKDLFTRPPNPTPLYLNDISVSDSQNYGSTTENVVLIGGKSIYNNNFVPNLVVTTQRPQHFVASTPASYLASTIASLRDRITAKPVLSDSFINRINKYLTFKR